MGAYNVVIGDPIRCASCSVEVRPNIAFYYGNKWQQTYSVGERLRWGGNDEGEPGHKLVAVRGYAMRCPNCASSTGTEDFDIILRDDIIESVEPASEAYDCLAENDHCVIEE